MAKKLRILGKRGRITVPYEIRQRVGFTTGDVLSFSETDDGKAVAVKREKLCNSCKASDQADGSDMTALIDFLNSLSDEQQRAAVLHLSVKWAKAQEKGSSDI